MKRDEVVAAFDHLASRYDAWYTTPLGAFANTREKEVLFRLTGVQPGERALDAGCGTGDYTLDLARRGIQAIGIDLAPAMLAVATSKAKAAGLPVGVIPAICLLDPDGDLVRHLIATNQARLNPYWACYHTQLYDFGYDGLGFGLVGCAVGASFAVLVAEELFASGCQLLISVTSSGQIRPVAQPPYFVLIDQALRDEGTSYHYLPPSDYSTIDNSLSCKLWRQRQKGGYPNTAQGKLIPSLIQPLAEEEY